MDDLISRQAEIDAFEKYMLCKDAIDAINHHFGFSVEEEYGSAVNEVIQTLPSAQQWIPLL